MSTNRIEYWVSVSTILCILLLSALSNVSYAQSEFGDLRGTVMTESNEQLPNANVIIEGTQRGASTDDNGQWI
jgi:hypothetical protein